MKMKMYEISNIWCRNTVMLLLSSVIDIWERNMSKKIIHTGHIRKYHKISKKWDFTYFQTKLHWIPQNSIVPVPELSIFHTWMKLSITLADINPFIKYSHFQNGKNRKMHFFQNFPNRFFSFFSYVNYITLATVWHRFRFSAIFFYLSAS